MTDSGRPENWQNGFIDSTFFNQTTGSHFVSKCNSTRISSNDFPPVCFTKNSLASAGDGTGTSIPDIRPLDETLGTCPKVYTSSSSLETSQTVASSFEFYVSSEEGINLFVDLNSSPSDWITQMRNEVSICQNVCRRSPISQKECGQLEESHHLIRSSFTCNLDSGKLKDFQEKTGSSPNLMIKNKNDVQPDHSDGGNMSLMSSAVKQHGKTSILPQKLEGGSGLSSSRSLPLVQDRMISVHPPSNGSACQMNSGYRFSENLTTNPVVNTAIGPVIAPETRTQNSNPYTYSAVHCNSSFGNNHIYVSASEVLPSCPTGGSMPVADFEVGVHSKTRPDSSGKSGTDNRPVSGWNASVPEDALADTNKINQKACQEQLQTSIEEQNIGSINGKENLGCSLDRLLGERLDSVEVIQELSKKRVHADSEDQRDCNSSEDKILRSSKHLTGEVLRRRSMRLVSK